MFKRETLISAGKRLRQLREEQQMTQQELEKRTADRFGAESRVYAQQVSRIEKGVIDKPPIIDLLRIGQILGLTPEDVFRMYDLWLTPTAESKAVDPRVQLVLDTLKELEEPYRDRFLEVLRFSALQARADKRLREREAQGEEHPTLSPDVTRKPPVRRS